MSLYMNNNMPLTPASSTTASSTSTKAGSQATLTPATTNTSSATGGAAPKGVRWRGIGYLNKVSMIPHDETFNEIYKKSRRERLTNKVRHFLEVAAEKLHLRKRKVETETERARREYKYRGWDDEYRGGEIKWRLQPCEHADGKYIQYGCCERDGDLEDFNKRRAEAYNMQARYKESRYSRREGRS